VNDLVETRLMLESETAYAAAARATEENLQKSKKHSKEGRSSDRPDEYLEHDLRFI
jgi:DNA-binding FadR family transcriptional regulator